MGHDRRRRPSARALAAAAAVGLVLSGCAGGLASSPEDLRIVARPEGLYLVTRSTAVARSLCIASGLDAARVEGRLFADGRRFAADDGRPGAGTRGCYMHIRDFVVCQDGDADCLGADRQARGGASRP